MRVVRVNHNLGNLRRINNLHKLYRRCKQSGLGANGTILRKLAAANSSSDDGCGATLQG
jgi:hypothetical protein